MSLRITLLAVSGERRVAAAAGATAATAGGAVAVAAAVAWSAEPARAAVALVVAVAALAIECAALAGYVIWLRNRVNRRMIVLLRPYQAVTVNRPAVAAAPAPPARGDAAAGEISLSLVAER